LTRILATWCVRVSRAGPVAPGEISAVRDAVDALDSDRIAVDHVQNPVSVNLQPVIPAPVESPGGERVIGQACDGSADCTHAVLVVHEVAG